MKNRLDALGAWLEHENADFALITSTPNVFYLTGFYTDPHERLLALFVFPNEEPILVLPKMEVQQARNAGWTCETLGYSDTDDPWELIKSRLSSRSINPKKVAVEKAHMTVERSESLLSLYPRITQISAETKLNQLRVLKDDKEINILREAARLADFGVEVGAQAIREGKTELEILAEIEFELKKKGINEMSFSTMVLTGDKTASPHGTPGDGRIQKGDFVLFDLGVVLDGYCSDITRTVAFGEITEEQQRLYETVHKAQLAALDVCKPGTEIGRVDKTARDIITSAGYGEYFTHRIGHGLGIDVHEFPSMNETNTDTLKEGMVFTVEPGIYVPGTGGVRIEDDLLITSNGVETLTKYPKELQTIR